MSEELDFGMDEKPLDETKISDLKEIIEHLRNVREELDMLAAEKKTLDEQETTLESRILLILEAHNLASFDAGDVKVYTSERVFVSGPKTPEKRQEFCDFLKAQGLFDNFVTFNAQKLTSYVRAEIEARKEQDPDWLPPGIEKPFTKKTLNVKGIRTNVG